RELSTRRLVGDRGPLAAVPLVLDADARNRRTYHRSILPRLSPQIVLTPHPAEFGRLAGLETSVVQQDRRGIASRFAKQWNKVVVLKGAGTVIAAPDGRVTQSPVATPALASGGTGDVLAGLIGGLVAQKVPPSEAAVTGVDRHGLARMGRAGWLGVSSVPEGIELRKAGITEPILNLGYTPPAALSAAVASKLSLTVYDRDGLDLVKMAATEIGVHVKVDSGMHRLGAAPE